LQSAGLPRIRFHDLRHTCATLLLGEGVHPKIVQELLGHASIRLTLDTYSHYLPDMQEKAVDAMRSALETPFQGEPEV
jgi:integrase